MSDLFSSGVERRRTSKLSPRLKSEQLQKKFLMSLDFKLVGLELIGNDKLNFFLVCGLVAEKREKYKMIPAYGTWQMVLLVYLPLLKDALTTNTTFMYEYNMLCEVAFKLTYFKLKIKPVFLLTL